MTRRLACFVLILFFSTTMSTAQVCDLDEVSTTAAAGSLSHSLVVGTTAFVAAGETGVVRIDIQDPNQMAVLDSTTTQGYAHDIALEYFDDRIVVADGAAGVGTYIIIEGQPVAHVATTDIGGTILSISGSAGDYVAGSEEGTLFLVTLSGEGQPVVEGQLQLAGEVVDVLEYSRVAYCALGTGGGVAVVDVLDRSDPMLLALHNLGGSVLSVTRSGELLIAGVDGVGVVALEIQDDGTLVEVDTLELSATPTSTFAWVDRLFMAGPELGLVEADTSLGAGVVQLGELSLPGSAGLTLVGDILFVGRGSQGFTAVDVSDCAAPDSAQTTWFIPAAARSPGASGSFWLTDLAIGNFSAGVATVNVAYLGKNVDNSQPLNISMAVRSGAQLFLGDLFFNLLGLDSANGGLRVVSSHPDMKITSRTYNSTGAEGTYGQFIPALPVTNALGIGGSGAILQLQQNDDFRTNIGLVNLRQVDVEVKVHLYHASGSYYGVVERTLLPFEMTQFDQIFTSAGAGTVDSGFAVVSVATSGGQVLAYASVVDNGSNDPVYIPAQRLSETSPFTQ
jgi:hypothetical protein